MYELLAIAASGTPEPVNWIPVASAVIAALAALAVAVISWWSQKEFRRADAEAKAEQRSAEFMRKQLDDLYGEMLLLRSTSKRLWTRLSGNQEGFRLIDSIGAIKEQNDPRRIRMVQEILKINERLATLIESRASLLTELPPPETFLAFLDHQRALASLWEMGIDADPAQPEPSFPRALDADIEIAINTIKRGLAELGAA